jgi:soluble lytic murein transglycosylase
MAKTERMSRRLGAVFIASYIVACGGGDTWRSTHVASPLSSAHVAARDSRHPPELRVVLNDPRLVAARDFQIARDFSAAAHVVDDERARPPTDAAASCAWAYVSGRLHALANESAAAAGSFDVVVAKKGECTLAPFAALRASQAYARAGNWQLSLQRAQAVPDDFLLRDEARVTLAEALAGNGQRQQAVAIWRDLLANHPHGNRWVDTAVRLAAALLDGVDGDPNSHAHEAYDLTTRVFVEAPKISDGSGATALRQRAASLIQSSDHSFVTDLDDDALSRQIQAWIDSGDAQKGVDDFNRSLQSRAQKSPPSCKLLVMRAQAMMKTKALSADAWGDAINACAGQDDLAVALYNGGRASVSAKKNSDAIERFEKLENLFPHHRLADDASERAALVYQDDGDTAKAEAKLLQIPDLYPDGDMSGDALFRVALARMVRGDWQAAKDPLDRAITFEADDRKPVSAARANYFRARASDATGDHADAIARYSQIVEQFPFSYFMLQAYARLATADADLAKKELDRAIAQAAATAPDVNAPADLFSDRAELARALLEVGEIEPAHQAVMPLLGDTADFDLTCAFGESFEDAGASDVGYALVHPRDFAAHYPAGKWKRAWQVAYPRPFLSFVLRESGADGTPMTLAYGIMREESRYSPDAKSPANAFGLMQLIPPTAKVVAQGTNFPSDAESLTRADVSIALGVKMLGQLRASNASNPHLAIPSYNAGPGAVQRWLAARPTEDFDLWIEQIPFDETRAYIKKVLASQATYAFLYDQGALADLLALPPRVSGK